MERATVEERVVKAIAWNLGLAPNEINPESNFRDDLDCDSLDEIEIVMVLEEEFEVDLDDGEVEKIKTVAEAIDLMARVTA